MFDLLISIAVILLGFSGLINTKRINKLEKELADMQKGDNSDDCSS